MLSRSLTWRVTVLIAVPLGSVAERRHHAGRHVVEVVAVERPLSGIVGIDSDGDRSHRRHQHGVAHRARRCAGRRWRRPGNGARADASDAPSSRHCVIVTSTRSPRSAMTGGQGLKPPAVGRHVADQCQIERLVRGPRCKGRGGLQTRASRARSSTGPASSPSAAILVTSAPAGRERCRFAARSPRAGRGSGTSAASAGKLQAHVDPLPHGHGKRRPAHRHDVLSVDGDQLALECARDRW